MQKQIAILSSGYAVKFHRSGVEEFTAVLTADEFFDLHCPKEIDLDECSGQIELALINYKHSHPLVQ